MFSAGFIEFTVGYIWLDTVLRVYFSTGELNSRDILRRIQRLEVTIYGTDRPGR